MKHRVFKIKKLFDAWSVPHFLFGMVTALVAITFSFSFLNAFLATFTIAFFWELLETRYRLSEAPGNGLIDILLALLALGITFLIIDRADPNPEHHMALLIVVSLLYMYVNFFAWRARFEHDRDFRG